MTDEERAGAFRAERLRYREGLCDAGASSGEAFDRTIYALAGATIAFTATYVKDIAPGIRPNWALYSCWSSAVLAIVLVALSQFLNQLAHSAAIDAVDAELEGNSEKHQSKATSRDRCQRAIWLFLNPASLIAAVASIVFFVAFIMHRVPKGPVSKDVANVRKETLSKTVPVKAAAPKDPKRTHSTEDAED